MSKTGGVVNNVYAKHIAWMIARIMARKIATAKNIGDLRWVPGVAGFIESRPQDIDRIVGYA